MNFLSEELEEYVANHTDSENELLYDLNRQTHIQLLQPRMLSGHIQGRVLSMLSHMIQPKVVLEIGTYTGYSALCLAEGLQDDGTLLTIDKNEELEPFTRSYFEKSKFSDRIDFRIGNAMEIIPSLSMEFDLVFIDADKSNYANYYDMVFNQVKPGGYIMADNVLWSGKVVEELNEKDIDTKALLEFNMKVQDDPRVENLLLAVRDGIMIARKK